MTVNDATPHIFNRQYFFVFPNEHLFQAAVCLIPAIEVFIDGVLVVSDRRPIGRIGSKSILKTYLDTNYPQSLQVAAKHIMEDVGGIVEAESPLSQALKTFKETKLAFVPVTEEGLVVATLAIRDILPLIAKYNVATPITSVSSPLIYVNKGITIREALTIMLKNNTRKLAVKDKDVTYLLSDREILDFIVLGEISKVAQTADKAGLLATKIDDLRMKVANEVSPETSISKAAELLMKQSPPVSLLLENSIVTPWDVVMKVLA